MLKNIREIIIFLHFFCRAKLYKLLFWAKTKLPLPDEILTSHDNQASTSNSKSPKPKIL
ncbi:hypothetical protein SAMN05216178_3096 [Pseudomonas saponiphila]|uniref:Uncharacterized protein n=1 Tax=Pseudomonas saponiphila TaxID=556534 RepID=A0A1H4P0H0_9PSED|nr:hypothetical protein SAMN05216178_3096 [Pseudomonas saponiphila]